MECVWFTGKYLRYSWNMETERKGRRMALSSDNEPDGYKKHRGLSEGRKGENTEEDQWEGRIDERKDQWVVMAAGRRSCSAKWLKSLLEPARQSCTHETVAYTARKACPLPFSTPCHDTLIFLACGVGMMNAQVEIVLEGDFSWQNGSKGCQVFSKM